jgi:hypothetical protein
MPLRVAFDLDGTLADFETAFREYEVRLLGPEEADAPAPEPEARDHDERGDAERDAADPGDVAAESAAAAEGLEATPRPQPRPVRRKLDLVWRAIESTPNFWTTLKPIDPGAVRRIHEMVERHRWEVFFITQRPATAGDTVQRQTQRWLIAQGFDMPSVLVVSGSRGRLAAALHLDYVVDDSPKNCLDIVSDSKARVFLIARDPNDRTEMSARRLGVGVVHSMAECLDLLEHATEMRTQPTLLGRLAKLIGWRAGG